MADGLEVKLIGDWRKFIAALDGPAMQRRVERQFIVANKRIGREFVRTAKRKIRQGAYAPNSPITIILKGSSRPLVDNGDLMQSITFDASDPAALKVGLIRAKSGAEQVNIGMILHEGATIDVRKNPAVRRRVWAKIRESVSASRLQSLTGRSRRSVVAAATQMGRRTGRRKASPMTPRQRAAFWARQPKQAGRTGKPIWRIPARPFILTPLNDPGFVAFVKTTWTDAVQMALFPKE